MLMGLDSQIRVPDTLLTYRNGPACCFRSWTLQEVA